MNIFIMIRQRWAIQMTAQHASNIIPVVPGTYPGTYRQTQ